MDNQINDPMFWGYAMAGTSLIIYAFVLWLQARGIWIASPRWKKIIRFFCLCLLLTPFAMRYHYSEAMILYLSALMIILGLLIKLKQKMGI